MIVHNPPDIFDAALSKNHLNTPRVITNSSGQVVWQWDNNDLYGVTPPNQNPTGQGMFVYNPRFRGQYYDQETGAHYNYYRDLYFPDLGRYGQSDPIGLGGGINTFAYGLGNPVSNVDPNGLQVCMMTPAGPVCTILPPMASAVPKLKPNALPDAANDTR